MVKSLFFQTTIYVGVTITLKQTNTDTPTCSKLSICPKNWEYSRLIKKIWMFYNRREKRTRRMASHYVEYEQLQLLMDWSGGINDRDPSNTQELGFCTWNIIGNSVTNIIKIQVQKVLMRREISMIILHFCPRTRAGSFWKEFSQNFSCIGKGWLWRNLVGLILNILCFLIRNFFKVKMKERYMCVPGND